MSTKEKKFLSVETPVPAPAPAPAESSDKKSRKKPVKTRSPRGRVLAESSDKKSRKKPVKTRSPRGRVLAFIIYPDNLEQMAFFDWCKHKERIIYIHHDPEEKAEINSSDTSLETSVHLCKEHFHVMILFNNPRTVNGFLKSSAGCLSHAEVVSDRMAYYRYMLHDTYACLKAHKKQYSDDDIFFTDEDFRNSCISFNDIESESYCITFLCGLIDDYCITSFVDFMHILQNINVEKRIISFAVRKAYFFSLYIKDISKGNYKKIQDISAPAETPVPAPAPAPAPVKPDLMCFTITKPDSTTTVYYSNSVDYPAMLTWISKTFPRSLGYICEISAI